MELSMTSCFHCPSIGKQSEKSISSKTLKTVHIATVLKSCSCCSSDLPNKIRSSANYWNFFFLYFVTHLKGSGDLADRISRSPGYKAALSACHDSLLTFCQYALAPNIKGANVYTSTDSETEIHNQK